jgi:hypothetical protein
MSLMTRFPTGFEALYRHDLLTILEEVCAFWRRFVPWMPGAAGLPFTMSSPLVGATLGAIARCDGPIKATRRTVTSKSESKR